MSVLRSGNAIKGIDQMKCCFESHFVLPLIIVHCFQFSFTVSQDHPKEELQHEQVEWEWCSITIKHQKRKAQRYAKLKHSSWKGAVALCGMRLCWRLIALSGATQQKRKEERQKRISREEKRVKRKSDQRHHFLFGLTLSGPFCSLCKGRILAWGSGWRRLWHMKCPLICPGRDRDHLTVKKK